MTLVYFAWVRQKTGIAQEILELPPGIATIGDLIEHLKNRGGGYAEVFGDPQRLRAAVNQTHVAFDATIAENDEVAFFPPVTGG
ncbi:MAG TPA: molybdopterin converting factor subunit 1 [Rhizomicrobium sp.]